MNKAEILDLNTDTELVDFFDLLARFDHVDKTKIILEANKGISDSAPEVPLLVSKNN